MLKELRNRHLHGRIGGQVSVCSANPMVLRAAAKQAKRDGSILLVEATASQVNLAGGYSGMTPSDFRSLVLHIGNNEGLASRQIVLGADHLAPNLWRRHAAQEAMHRTQALTQAFVAAGYQKLHLDTAGRCTDDPPGRLPVEIAARRAAVLCQTAETAALENHREPPLYTIGTEVPAPGGALSPDRTIAVTDPRQVQYELSLYERAFGQAGVERAWQRVIAIVVQPGVDFSDHHAAVYNPSAAMALSAFHQQLPGHMTYEIHAADYQPPLAIGQMVEGHFVLIKIGPCLTFALREALFALAHIEKATPNLDKRSDLIEIMTRLMQSHPEHWRKQYTAGDATLRYLMHYSLRDRIRYYWSLPQAQQACRQLMENLRRPAAVPLLRQFLPDLVDAIANGTQSPAPEAIIQARIQGMLRNYTEACQTRN